jgi:hypothetical protein
VGARLRELVEKSCAESKYPFKVDSKTWGVTLDDDLRFAAAEFGTYKSTLRTATEERLRKYMREPSIPRATTATSFEMKDFQIAVTVAAPGTGKTRLIDDALRMPLDAKPGEQEHFDHFLRLAVTFNANYGGSYAHPLTARMLLMFFCGTVDESAEKALRHIDAKLVQLFPGKVVDSVARNVLNALEALYFDQRADGKLGRTVLLIDEISKADMKDATRVTSERHVYESVVGWLNGGVMAGSQVGRRGAVFTGLSAIAPWSERTARSGRSIVWLPLGTFDLWDEKVRIVVADQAKAIKNWPADAVISDRVWYVFAATGGRPRDVSRMLQLLSPVLRRDQPFADELLSNLFVAPAEVPFRRYLLPSMLNIKFFAMTAERTITQFGRDAASLALLNADQLATGEIESAVPSVSLGHAAAVEGSNEKLFDEIKAVIWSTTFCKLDGSGKDFERVWVLLVHTVLRLQHIVRCSDSDFWPRLEECAVLGGLARPTRQVLDVFASAKSDKARAGALFGRPGDKRVYEVQGSSIRRELPLKRDPPTLAWWQSVWTANVVPGTRDDIPVGWSVARDVVWRPWTVAYFADATHEAVDFALMVGDAGGTDANAPHVYLFQCKELTSKNVTQGTATTKDDNTMVKIVAKLRAQLDLLFSADFAATHVWRCAGINSVKQVTLCVAAINLSDKIELKKLDAPFNIVLFDGADFRALGGAAFGDTYFFRYLKTMNLN